MLRQLIKAWNTVKSNKVDDQYAYINSKTVLKNHPDVLQHLLSMRMVSHAVNNIESDNKNLYFSYYKQYNIKYDGVNFHIVIGLMVNPVNTQNCGDWADHIHRFSKFWSTNKSSDLKFKVQVLSQVIHVDINGQCVYDNKDPKDGRYKVSIHSPAIMSNLFLHDVIQNLEDYVAVMNYKTSDERYNVYIKNSKYFRGIISKIPKIVMCKELKIEIFCSMINDLDLGVEVDKNLVFHYSSTISRDPITLIDFFKAHNDDSVLASETLLKHVECVSNDHEKINKLIKLHNIQR